MVKRKRLIHRVSSDALFSVKKQEIKIDVRASKIYQITEKGKQEFLNWLNSSVPMVEPRIPWLIQVFFAARLSDEAIINIFQQVADQIRSRIGAYEKIKEEGLSAENDTFTQRDLFFMELTHDYGLMLHNSILQWIEKVKKQIEEKEHR